MPKSTEPTRVLVISNNQLITESIEAAFLKETDFSLVDSECLTDGIIPGIHLSQPDIILMDYQYQGEELYDIIDDIAAQFPSSAIIVILPEGEVQNSHRVILAGARAFLLHPFSQINLLSTLRRVKELHSRTAGSQQQAALVTPSARAKRTFMVYSPKGGVGCTTIAINLAIAMYQGHGEEVLLVDGKHLFGHVGVMLNLRTMNSIADLLPHSGTLDETMIRQVVSKHTSGIHVLPSPPSISVAQGIRPDELYSVIRGLQNVFANIIVDGGSYLSENAVTYMDSSYKVILVVSPDLASLRDARQYLDVTRSLSYPREKILLMLNQIGRKSDVKMADIEKVLHAKVFGTIPVDDEIALSSVNEGVPIILKKPNHPISKAIKKIAKSLDMLSPAPGEIRLVGSEKTSDLLAKTSRLG